VHLAAVLTLAGAVRYALVHSPAVAKQAAVVAQLESSYVKARSQTLPGIQGQLQNQMQKTANYTGNYAAIGAAQASVFSQNTASVGTSYLWNGGLNHYLSLAAKQQYEGALSDLRATQMQVTDNVTAAFFTLAGDDETVRLDDGDLRYQQTLLSVAQAKESAGVAAGVDVLSAEAAVEKSRYALTSAQAASEDARESLAQTIGAPLDTQFTVPVDVAQPALPSQPLDTLIATAQANRADVASAQEAVEVAITNRRSADADLWPQIQPFAQIGNQFSPTLAVQQSKFGPVSRGVPGFWNIGVQSSISLPFVDWGARSANHRNLDEQIAAAQSNLQAVRVQAEIDVRQSYRAAGTALAQVASAQDETRYASEAARIAQLQYEHGIITLPDVQQRQQASLSAQVDLYNARVAYAYALVKLRAALGIYTPEQDVADFS
jgi:outer membrane protein TolC